MGGDLQGEKMTIIGIALFIIGGLIACMMLGLIEWPKFLPHLNIAESSGFIVSVFFICVAIVGFIMATKGFIG